MSQQTEPSPNAPQEEENPRPHRRGRAKDESLATPAEADRREKASLLEAADLVAMLGPEVEAFSPEERRHIATAFRLADQSHKGVKRCSGDPYITHPVAVARTLLEMGLDWQTICAALLHDTIEDTTLTYDDIQAQLPEPIADLVDGVTKISTVNFRSSHEEQIENLRKMILAMAQDIRVILIKLADRQHNLQTLKYLPATKQKRIARTTLEIYAPLAGRLGIYRIKSQIEDAAMRYLYPDVYRDLTAKIEVKRRDRERHIEESIAFLSRELAEQGIKAEVTGRPKHFWSIFNKMRNQDRSFEEIYDLNALRVICESTKACYEILGVIHSVWKPLPEHFSDYIALPKANMYQSIHTKVIGLNGQLTEIQVRTQDMHRTAEEGIAAHWSYKEGRRVTAENKERLGWLRQMVSWIQDANAPGEILSDLKREAFQDKVFCFTPQGDVIEMARGATVLDFAYRIHTDLGNRCMGGRINHKFVPLRTELRMSDVVEIVTTKQPHVSASWLTIVTTARARAKIRHTLKLRDYQENRRLGRDMIGKALAKAGVHLGAQALTERLEPHCKGLHAKTVDDLYAEVGFGTIPTTMVVGRVLPTTPEQPSRRRVSSTQAKNAIILVDGSPGSLTRMAQCCRPQPGDPIAGFVTRGRGISIHHNDCPHLNRWMAESPDHLGRFVPVSWSSKGESQYRSYGVRIIAEDRRGVLSELTQTISIMDIVITASSSRSDLRSHRATVRFTVLVRDEAQLNAMMERLRGVDDVIRVVRDPKFRK